MTNPVNTQKITSFQPAKVDAEPVKQKSKTIDILEPSKNGTETTSGTNSKSWFSTCLEKIWNFFKCLFCCGYLKKDTESSTTSKSETDSSKKEASSTPNSATSKSHTDEQTGSATATRKKDGISKIKTTLDKSQAGKISGYERDIFALRWNIEAMENKDEEEFIKAQIYMGYPAADRAHHLQDLRANLADINGAKRMLNEMLKVKKFATLVLTKESSNDEAFNAWQDLGFSERDDFRTIMKKVYRSTNEDSDARDAILSYFTLDGQSDFDKNVDNIKAHIKSPLMQLACQRLLDWGTDRAIR